MSPRPVTDALGRTAATAARVAVIRAGIRFAHRRPAVPGCGAGGAVRTGHVPSPAGHIDGLAACGAAGRLDGPTVCGLVGHIDGLVLCGPVAVSGGGFRVEVVGGYAEVASRFGKEFVVSHRGLDPAVLAGSRF